MLVLLLILLPLATASLILGIRLLRPGFTHHWLLAVLGSLSAWILAWFIRPQTPLNLPLANWQPREFLPISPALLLDSKSWPFYRPGHACTCCSHRWCFQTLVAQQILV
jgi:hypothetical protein